MVESPRKVADEKTRARLTRSASYASLTIALTLVAAKLWAWQVTDAVAVLSSLVDSFLDVLASGITFVAVRFSLAPADSEHRFGHGKSEGLAALAQSLIISLSAIYVWAEAIQRLRSPEPVHEPLAGVAVIILSILLTLGLLSFQRHVVRRTGSVAIQADAMHYRTDLLVNIGVVISIPVASFTTWTIVDPLVGIGVAAYIIWGTYSIASRSLDILLDREIPEADRERIREVALSHPAIRGFHDLRTRYGGSSYIIQFHLELDPKTTLLDTHLILDDVEGRIRAELGQCEIIVHADPIGLPEHRDSFE